jgi:hypothetical protein
MILHHLMLVWRATGTGIYRWSAFIPTEDDDKPQIGEHRKM